MKKKLSFGVLASLLSVVFAMIWWQASHSWVFQKAFVPGLAIAYIDGKEIELVCKGFAQKGMPVECHTVFQLASLSKPLFAYAVLEWARSKGISLHSPIGEVFCRTKVPFIHEFATAMISQILSHRAGVIPIQYAGYLDPTVCLNLEQSLRGIRGFHPPIRSICHPGEFFQYSGGGYSLLEYLITNEEQCTTVAFLKRYLGVDLPDPSDDAFSKCKASGHTEFGIPMKPRYFVETAAAGMHLSIADIAAFLKKVMQSAEKNTIKEMMDCCQGSYGKGIEVERIGKYELGFHLGANPGWRCGLFFIPRRELGLVVLTNSSAGNRVVMENVKSWLSSKGLPFPGFLKKDYRKQRGWLFLSVICWVFFGYRIATIRNNRKIIRRNFWHKCLLSSVALIILCVIGIFYLSWLPPKGWVLSSFMPWEFHLVVLCLICEITIEVIYHLKNQSIRSNI